MGYFPGTGGGGGGDHTHFNLAILNAISNAGSGAIITSAERTKLNAPFIPPAGTDDLWDGPPPDNLHDAVGQIATKLATHIGPLST
jgi:hypothetical protein